MFKERDYKDYIELFTEAYNLGVTDLFNKVFKLGYSQGYNDAIKRFEEE